MSKYKNYRICYENGNPKTGQKIYELYKYCECSGCKFRWKNRKEVCNKITVTTTDIAKIDSIAEFLENWTCENGEIRLPIVYAEM